MGKIFCIMGKSAAGKDTLYRELLERCPWLRTYVMYTTRPIRAEEVRQELERMLRREKEDPHV